MLVKDAFIRILKLVESDAGTFSPLQTDLLESIEKLPNQEFRIPVVVSSLLRIGEFWGCTYIQKTHPDFNEVLASFSSYILKLAKHISPMSPARMPSSLIATLCFCIFTMQYSAIMGKIDQSLVRSIFESFKKAGDENEVAAAISSMFDCYPSEN